MVAPDHRFRPIVNAALPEHVRPYNSQSPGQLPVSVPAAVDHSPLWPVSFLLRDS
jgi:hypothetical protein